MIHVLLMLAKVERKMHNNGDINDFWKWSGYVSNNSKLQQDYIKYFGRRLTKLSPSVKSGGALVMFAPHIHLGRRKDCEARHFTRTACGEELSPVVISFCIK